MSPADVVAVLRRRLSPRRLAHTLRVADTAARLAGVHGMDEARARLAGLLHDYCREEPEAVLRDHARRLGLRGAERWPAAVLHGPVAAGILPTDLGVRDPAVLTAVARHTTGDPGMVRLDAALLLADRTEPGHDYPGVSQLRGLAERDLWAATASALDASIAHLLRYGLTPDPRTLLARNAVAARAAPPGPWRAPGTTVAAGPAVDEAVGGTA